MELWKYVGKQVEIVTKDNEIIVGKACDFIPAQDNIPEIASVSIGDIEIYENEISEIKEV